MKNNIKYLILLAAFSIMGVSCKRELLNPQPQTSITDASAFDTPSRILNQLLSVYGTFKAGAFHGGRAVAASEIKGEDFFAETSNLVVGFDVWNLNVANSATFINNIWNQGYLTINRANVFIDGMNAKGAAVVGQGIANNYIAEARLIRAVSYHILLQYFARPYADGNGSKPGLPLRLSGIVGSGQSDLARSTVAEVYTQILADLDFAEANLPLDYPSGGTQATNRTTRAHRNTAIALKTRVYLSMQRYTDVITEANKIVPASAPFVATSGVPHALQADVTNVFKSPYTTTESIFSLPMTTTTGDFPGTQNQLGLYYYSASGPGTGEYSLNPNGILGDPQWGPTDKRRAMVYTNPSNNKKYLSKFPTLAAAQYTDWVPVIRWPEVLLNLAEALARTNTGVNARALALLRAVHERSDPTLILAPTTQSELIDMILKERRIEFLGEGLRNMDLMRLLQTIPAKGSAPSKAPNESQYIWPISATELSTNKLMTDNP